MPRIATGAKRPNPFQIGLDDLEEEYSQRRAFADKESRAELFRAAFFKPGWKERELPALRNAQRNIPRKRIFGTAA